MIMDFEMLKTNTPTLLKIKNMGESWTHPEKEMNIFDIVF